MKNYLKENKPPLETLVRKLSANRDFIDVSET